MIDFQRFVLKNGLRVLIHEDNSTPLVALSLLYDVGSRDENPLRTGFAHLFEHLMFAGSANVPDFDLPIQLAGGENNAFTNNDMTNFYATVPAENLETLLWIESDRMLKLNINARSLNVQRKVVVEEFKETTLNEPYGDMWHHISEMLYTTHTYRWPVIGLEPKHIEEASLTDVKNFYKNFYVPNNAILVIAGNLEKSTVDFDIETASYQLEESVIPRFLEGQANILRIARRIEQWFGHIPTGEVPIRQLPQEPTHTQQVRKVVESNVPVEALYMAFLSPARKDESYYAVDLLTDVLSNGSSSRFYRRLLKEQRLFSEIDCFQTGNIDPGVILIEGKPAEGVTLEQAEAALWAELNLLKKELIADHELQKLKNKIESQQAFGDAGALNKAMNITYYELLGDANLINTEIEKYNTITITDIQTVAQQFFTPENSAVLYYKPKKNA
jgi:predicted Zn-dependent peptidase